MVCWPADENFHFSLTPQESNLLIFKAATLAFGALLCPSDWVIRQRNCRTTLSNATRPTSFYFSVYKPENTKRKEQEGGEKLSDDVSTKSYYTQKVILVYLSSLLSLLVQAYRNRQFDFFFPFFSEPSEPRLAPLCCVQRSMHLFSTTGKVFVFICFYKLQGAEAFRGATVFLSPPRRYAWPVLAPPCTSAEGHECRWLQGLEPLSMCYHCLMKLGCI